MNRIFFLQLVLSISIISSPIALLVHRTKVKKGDGTGFGLGVRVVQFAGVSIIPPVIAILALEGLIDAGTVSALIGALVGYLFAGIVDFDRHRPDSQQSK